MAKALHDGRAFPLRISFALARIICGEELELTDLGGVINRHHFNMLMLLHSSVSSGTPISEDVWYQRSLDTLDFTIHTNVVGQGCRGIVEDISKQLHLVPHGDKRDVTNENAAEYLNAVRRIYLEDGVAMQISALRAGFYSVIEQRHVAILGACGLLHQLGCLGVPVFELHDLRSGLTPQAPYVSNSPQYIWLLDVLTKLEERDRQAFVRFVTGAPWLPNGFQGLKNPLKVQLYTTGTGAPCDDSYHPYAQTCSGLLKLPP